jgi:hypothetical protein
MKVLKPTILVYDSTKIIKSGFNWSVAIDPQEAGVAILQAIVIDSQE